jgi:hypothetical protein
MSIGISSCQTSLNVKNPFSLESPVLHSIEKVGCLMRLARACVLQRITMGGKTEDGL